MSDWIDVKVKLPDKDGVYLVTRVNETDLGSYYQTSHDPTLYAGLFRDVNFSYEKAYEELCRRRSKYENIKICFLSVDISTYFTAHGEFISVLDETDSRPIMHWMELPKPPNWVKGEMTVVKGEVKTETKGERE